ncbi:hypothetical protein RHMOL_Rhmol11G0174200 [Rhododendron molle]|uniref:Uncharacterized protein n=1 Tax=Rhododendron molle TaxID=49168 RepID=A0ACC0LUY4_RHOML|nr:hypothetical protein RHMOL_Rhmol11G0174200 [Rhododendron molle]
MGESLVLRGTMRAHTNWVTAIATPIDNSHMIVTASRNKSIILWNLTKEDKVYGLPHRRVTGHSHFVQDVVLSSDGQFALSGSWDGELRLWDLASGTTARSFVGHTKDVLSIAFSVDNRQIVSASRDRSIKLWNTLAIEASIKIWDLESKTAVKDSDAVKEALDQLTKVGWAKKWSSQPYVSRRMTSLRELTTLGIKNADNLAIPSVRNDAAFLFTVVGTTGFVGVLAGQLPGFNGKKTYTKAEIDEVRAEWIKPVVAFGHVAVVPVCCFSITRPVVAFWENSQGRSTCSRNTGTLRLSRIPKDWIENHLSRCTLSICFYVVVVVVVDETSVASGNPYLLYALTVSGVAYLFRLKSIDDYASYSVLPPNQITEYNMQSYPPHGTITAVAATAGCLVLGRNDGSVGCFQLGILEPGAPGER